MTAASIICPKLQNALITCFWVKQAPNYFNFVFLIKKGNFLNVG